MKTELTFDTQVNWDKATGLIPAIIQDEATLQVLMLGYMNQEALQITLETRKVTFYSRSKNRLWTKGETSGNTLSVVRVQTDCDQDALLISVKPKGNTCHLNNPSCFGEEVAPGLGMLARLASLIQERYEQRPPNSYVTSLFAEGLRRMAQKVGEEGVELALASVTGSKEDVINEAADLLFHLLVLLNASQVDLALVMQELKRRSS